MKLWGIGFETNKNNIFIQIFKVIVTGCCWGWRCKFAKKIGLNKFLSQHREVLWWLLFSVWSLAQELCNQFLYETGRINHRTIHRINHALFLFSFPKDPLLAFGLSGPFIRQIREFPVTRVDTEEPMPVLVLNFSPQQNDLVMEQSKMSFQTHLHWHYLLWTWIHLFFLGICGTLASFSL